jgi:hypothetical protein
LSHFEIIASGTAVKKHQITSIHLMSGLLLMVMGAVTWAIPDAAKTIVYNYLNYAGLCYAFTGLMIIVISIFFNKKIIQHPGKNIVLRIFEGILLGSILIYCLIKQWYLPAAWSGAGFIAVMLAMFIENTSTKHKMIIVNEEGVLLPGLARNVTLPWQDIQRLLLKHNVITIDCRDNKLYQFEVNKERLAYNAADIEDFARDKIASNADKYQKDW